MNEVIFMFLYDSTYKNDTPSVKGLTCIDLKKSTNKNISNLEELKGPKGPKEIPVLLIHYNGVTKYYSYTKENLEKIKNKIEELFEDAK